jgi:hypothetical protein
MKILQHPAMSAQKQKTLDQRPQGLELLSTDLPLALFFTWLQLAGPSSGPKSIHVIKNVPPLACERNGLGNASRPANVKNLPRGLACLQIRRNNDSLTFYSGGFMRKLRLLLLASTAAAGLYAQFNPPKTHLKVGDEAPDFTLPSTAGQQVKLSDFRGKKNVVLAFFPAAFTGG